MSNWLFFFIQSFNSNSFSKSHKIRSRIIRLARRDVIREKTIGPGDHSPRHFTLWPSLKVMPSHWLGKCSVMCSAVILCSLQVKFVRETEMRRGNGVHAAEMLKRRKIVMSVFFFNCQKSRGAHVCVYVLTCLPILVWTKPWRTIFIVGTLWLNRTDFSVKF